jgi:hypothetical protein
MELHQVRCLGRMGQAVSMSVEVRSVISQACSDVGERKVRVAVHFSLAIPLHSKPSNHHSRVRLISWELITFLNMRCEADCRSLRYSHTLQPSAGLTVSTTKSPSELRHVNERKTSKYSIKKETVIGHVYNVRYRSMVRR